MSEGPAPTSHAARLGLLDESTLRTFIDSVRDYAMFMLDPSGTIMSWNAGAEAIKGYAAHEIIGSHFSRFYPPEALARGLPEHELKTATATGRFEDEGWRVRKDGTYFWANVVITALRDQRGRLIGFAKVTRDLSERRRQEERLRLSEDRFRLLVDGVKDYAIFMLDTDGIVITWNTGARQIKGYDASDIIGSHFSRFYPPESIKRELPAHELRSARLEGRFEDEGWRVRKDGSRFWANVILTAMRDASGTLIGFSKITRDLTERRANEERLRISEERFRLLVDGVTEYAIVVLDQDGAVSSWNAGAERIEGYTLHEIFGKHFSHFFTPEDIGASRPWQLLSKARLEGRVLDEGWRVRKDRTLFWANTVLTALHDADANHYGFAMVTQDLTQRREAESLADATQRMQEFIAMLAHELRNPLAPIRNAVELMGRKGLTDPTLEAMRQTIARQSAHLTRLLDELLDVNRIARGQLSISKSTVDLLEVLARALESCRPGIDARGHRLTVQLPQRPLYVAGDGVRLTQVFVNLLNNAAKYTPSGGDITLRAAELGVDAEVRVLDTGRGIQRDQLERAFDLFVQLEPADIAEGGLGVGLALVRKVVELHAGSVQARSEGPGRGSEFIVRLPLAAEGMRPIDDAEPRLRAASGRLRVLVVDDNRDSADTLQLLLQSMHQEVRCAYDGASALALASSFRPHVVLLDIGMPHMSGYEVAKALRHSDLQPKPLLAAATGWGQDIDRLRSHASGFDFHFVKPVRLEDLNAIISATCADSTRPL
jgi:PAS domain S-box-containing protein